MNRYTIYTTCPQCKSRYIPELMGLDPKQFVKAWSRWHSGELLIQNAFPAAQSYQREQLQTGICSDACWDKMFETANEVLEAQHDARLNH